MVCWTMQGQTLLIPHAGFHIEIFIWGGSRRGTFTSSPLHKPLIFVILGEVISYVLQH